MKTVAIIPARGGSKGIPQKNIVDLAGKPLIAYSILAASKARCIDEVFVSTDDKQIAEVAISFGASVPGLRPKIFATDDAAIGGALSYSYKEFGIDTKTTNIVQLYPTSPFRTAAFIDEMITLLNNGYQSVKTVRRIGVPRKYIYHLQNGEMNCIFGLAETIPEWKLFYRDYPVFFATAPASREKVHFYYELTDKAMLVDIDTYEDLHIAQEIISRSLFEFDY